MSPSLERRPGGSVRTALEILAQVARAGPGLTAKEISASLRIPPASAYRILNQLVGEEYLVRLSDLSGFALGAGAGAMVTPLTVPFVSTAARDVVDGIRQRVRFGVHLVLYAAGTLRAADVDPDRPLVAPRALGRYPHASAAGKLLLADAPDWRALMPMTDFRRLTPATLADAERLERCLDDVRREHLARARGELREETACLAVPVRSAAGALAAGLLLSAPLARAEALEEHLDLLRAACERLAPLVS